MDDDKKLEIQELCLRDMVPYIKKHIFSLIKRKPKLKIHQPKPNRIKFTEQHLKRISWYTFCIVYGKD